jgi:hypothetical protein
MRKYLGEKRIRLRKTKSGAMETLPAVPRVPLRQSMGWQLFTSNFVLKYSCPSPKAI